MSDRVCHGREAAAARTERGIVRRESGEWLAVERDVRDGKVTRERMLASFAGPGSRARAIQTAGSNTRLA